ncbi:MAG: glycosyltransferase family 2 protein [Anaerolineae bacterium]|nr:glycosyltransferase family 2 protein [Anaerolineae bacterium]
MQNTRVLAIILNWRQAQTTIACVRALQEMSCSFLDTLIIDNGSGDDSVSQMKEHFQEDVKILALSENLGFAGGCNIGLQTAVENKYHYALLINNDAFATPGMLEELLAKATPDIALLSPKIFYASDPTRIWFANGRMNPYTLDLYDTGRNEQDSQKWCKTQDTEYLLGTCLLVHLNAMQNVGLLDERFFMYFEDLDWSMRFRQKGYRLQIVTSAHLYHKVAISSGGLDSPIRRYHLAKSGMIFWRRYAHKGNLPVIILFRLGSILKTMTRLLFTGKFSAAHSYLKGLQDGWQVSL